MNDIKGEIKNKTIYTPDNVKKFLEVYYFEKGNLQNDAVLRECLC